MTVTETVKHAIGIDSGAEARKPIQPYRFSHVVLSS
jgi:hypothetical protein